MDKVKDISLDRATDSRSNKIMFTFISYIQVYGQLKTEKKIFSCFFSNLQLSIFGGLVPFCYYSPIYLRI